MLNRWEGSGQQRKRTKMRELRESEMRIRKILHAENREEDGGNEEGSRCEFGHRRDG